MLMKNLALTAGTARQDHMRCVRGRICREREVNLYLHLQHLSEEKNCKNEWQFAESRPIEHGEHNVCLCGQTHRIVLLCRKQMERKSHLRGLRLCNKRGSQSSSCDWLFQAYFRKHSVRDIQGAR